MGRLGRLRGLVALCAAAAAVGLAGCEGCKGRGDAQAVDAGPAGPTLAQEKEPNDTPEQALAITRDTDVTAALGADPARPDEDWYLLEPQAQGRVDVRVSGLPGGDVALEVYDEDRNRLVAVNSEGEGQGERLPNLLVPRRRLLKVLPARRGAGGSYTLQVRFTDAPAGEEQEPNDRAADANVVPLGTPVQALLGHAGDEDWYRFDLAGPDGAPAGAPPAPGSPPPGSTAPDSAAPDSAAPDSAAPDSTPPASPAPAPGGAAPGSPGPAGPSGAPAVPGAAPAGEPAAPPAGGPAAPIPGAAPPEGAPSSPEEEGARAQAAAEQAMGQAEGVPTPPPAEGGALDGLPVAGLPPADAGAVPPAPEGPPPTPLRLELTAVPGVRYEVRVLSAAEAPLFEVRGNEGEGLSLRNVAVRGSDRSFFVVVRSTWNGTGKGARRGYDAQTPYTLTVSAEEAGADAELEPNDEPARATPLPAPAGTHAFREGFLAPKTDVDYFAVQTGGPSIVDLQLSGVERLDLTLSVVERLEAGGERVLLTSKDGAVKEPEHLTNVACPGTCLVKVEGGLRQVAGKWVKDFENPEQPYRLTATASPDTGAREREPNNAADRATPLLPGQPVRGTVHPRKDVDYFQLDLREREVRTPVSARLLGILKVDVGLYLHRVGADGKLALVQTADRRKGEEPEVIRYSAEPGLYVLEVRDSRNRESNFQDSYQLLVEEGE
jgi:hypothetical protein